MLKTADAVMRAADQLASARRVVVTTGAGMSRESGLPTFREALTGLWARFDPEALATEAAFRRHPAQVFGWYAWRRGLARAAVPHAGYHALVALERLVGELVVVTQNVDGLHGRVGSSRVLELHGSLERFSCLEARHPFPASDVPAPAPEPEGACEPPRCRRCGALVRPDVVWFGEPLPAEVMRAAWEASARCDTMLVVGTSGLVHPAAELPVIARRAGATVIEINPEPSEISPVAHVACRGLAGAVLPALVTALTERESP
jgi:NAD-dependent deacetylase